MMLETAHDQHSALIIYVCSSQTAESGRQCLSTHRLLLFGDSLLTYQY